MSREVKSIKTARYLHREHRSKKGRQWPRKKDFSQVDYKRKKKKLKIKELKKTYE